MEVPFVPAATVCAGCGFKYGHNVGCPWVLAYMEEQRMERIDRKFTFSGSCTEHQPHTS